MLPEVHDGWTQRKGGQTLQSRQGSGGLRATWQRGTRRDGTQNPQGRRRELRVGEGNQGHPRAPPSGQETAGHSDKAYQTAVPAGKPKPRRRTKRGKAIKARPATTTTSKSKAAPPPRTARRNTKRKRPTTPPSSSSSSSSSSTTQAGTGQPGQPAKDRGDQDSDDLLSSEEVIQDVALLDILNYQHPDDKTKKHNKRKKRREEKVNDTKAETEEHPPRRGGTAKGVDPRSVGAAPAIGPFTASTSSSASGNTTMGEQALYQQARAKRREVEDYEQTQHLGKGEAYRPMPQLRHWVPGSTRPADQANHHGEEGKKEANHHTRDSLRRS